MGMQREFPLGQRRVCPDICGRQTFRRPHCECVHPDFVDHAWVPLNSPCRNFFGGHCHKEGGCPNLHADTFPEAVYAAFRQLTMKRPSTRLHYVQHRSIFRFVTRSEAMDMIQTSLTTSDTMAIKQFIMGMSWTRFPTASSYENHLARERTPEPAKGGTGAPAIVIDHRHRRGGGLLHQGGIGHLRLHQRCHGLSTRPLLPVQHRVRHHPSVSHRSRSGAQRRHRNHQ